jgi:hypothetical protein
LKSICNLDLVLDVTSFSSSPFEVEDIAEIERQTATYFAELLAVEEEINKYLTTVLKVSVGVQKSRPTNTGEVTLDTVVDLVYRSDEGIPLHLDHILAELVSADSSTFKPNGITTISLDFHAVEDDSRIIFVEAGEDGQRSSADVGLIAACAILSAILVLVSSVLLYITGGWDAFQRAVTNCLFEEIEEDDENYLAHSKSTFQVQSSDEAENEGDEEDDSSSIETGMQSPMTNPSGMLGGLPATQGLGIMTPGHNTTGYGEYTPDDDTRMTASSSNHLGITSMRKMPQDGPSESQSGLTQMIMQRLYNNDNNPNYNNK